MIQREINIINEQFSVFFKYKKLYYFFIKTISYTNYIYYIDN